MGRRKQRAEQHKITKAYLGGKRRLPLLKEEVWRDTSGKVTRYSLAYIDPEMFAADNGRVLGYDNAHGRHHRHFHGKETEFKFSSYDDLVSRFETEVLALRRAK